MQASEGERGLSWSERWFALRCIFLLQAVSISIRFWGFNPVYAWVEHRVQGSSIHPVVDKEAIDAAVHIGALVGVANRRVPLFKVTCLPESLAVWWLLRRRGIQADLRLGVRKLDGRLDGHAWVETNNRVVSGNPNQAKEYIPLDVISGSQ